MRFILIRTGSIVYDAYQHVCAGDVIVMAPEAQCRFEPEGLTTVTTAEADMDLVSDLVRWRFAARLAARTDAADMLTCRYPDPVFAVRMGEERMGMISPQVDELVSLTIDRQFGNRFYRFVSDLTAMLDTILPVLVPSARGNATETRVRPAFAGRTCTGTQPQRHEARTIALAFRKNLSKRWSLAELAELVHLSPSQVRRVMIASYGQTPLAYLNRLRAEESARLLRETNIALVSAYREVGWASRSYAVRVFTEVVGMKPSEYARRHRPAE
ncbi:helix-turn-helix transcriptional regulator [Skermania piniformis]|uniref:AraC family transcriptional regulator n=1 Tax=Skermania pinensis TaxID=39122 RepID=A0ABX8S5D0_9ACTN|nr:AraC family transcriptional regulator [Skermania piniformis]QXQ13043.1 AraC family transcriptional regulator [Skermania piniformis]